MVDPSLKAHDKISVPWTVQRVLRSIPSGLPPILVSQLNLFLQALTAAFADSGLLAIWVIANSPLAMGDSDHEKTARTFYRRVGALFGEYGLEGVLTYIKTNFLDCFQRVAQMYDEEKK